MSPQKVRFGLVGYGMWAQRVHMPSIRLAENAELVAICGPDAQRAAETAEQFGAAWSTNEVEKVLHSPEIDAVLIAAPNDVHAPVAMAAARAGKAVMCEKPLGVTLQQAVEMTRVVQEAGVTHMTAFTWRNVPAVRLARQLILENKMGRVFDISARFLHGSGLVFEGKRLWRFDRERMGSGILGDLGSHMFDMLVWVVGQPVTRVCAQLGSFGSKPETPGKKPVYDDAQILLEFAGGAHGSLQVSRVAPARHQTPWQDMEQMFEIFCEQGGISYRLHDHSQIALRRFKTDEERVPAPEPLPDSQDEWVVTRELGRRQISLFANAVLRGEKLQPGFEAGLTAQVLMDAAERSQDTGGWVDVIYPS